MSSLSLRNNIASLIGQRNLARVDSDLARTLERLSSGSRINRASDDAAGLSVSSFLRLNSRVYTQAVRNGNDAISALNISDGALSGMSTIIERIQELATQSANGTLSSAQRRTLNTEAQQLKDEFERIQRSTTFNGLQLVENGTSALNVQLGYGSRNVLGTRVGIIGTGGEGGYEGHSDAGAANSSTGIRPYGLGDYDGDGDQDMMRVEGGEARLYLNTGNGFEETGTLIDGAVNGTMRSITSADVNGDGTDEFVFVTTTADAYVLGQSVSNVTNLGLSNVGLLEVADITNDGNLEIVVSYGIPQNSVYAATILSDGSVDVNITTHSFGTQISALALKPYGATEGSVIVQTQGGAVLELKSAGGPDPSFSSDVFVGTWSSDQVLRVIGDINGDGDADLAVGSGNTLDLVSLDGNYAIITSLTVNNITSVAFGDYNNDSIDDIVGLSEDGTVSFFAGDGAGNFSLESTASDASGPQSYTLNLADINDDGYLDAIAWDYSTGTVRTYTSTGLDAVTLDDFSLLTAAGATAAFSTLEDARTKLRNTRSEVGATMSRLESALGNLTSLALNSEAALGRIEDADIAMETANYIRSQILRDTSTALLAQANQAPQIALTLLQAA